jgi:hypothetical protein
MNHKPVDIRGRVMSILNAKTDEELKQEFAEMDAVMEEQDKEYNRRRWVSWLASAALHVSVLLIMATFVYTNMKPVDIDAPPMRIATMTPIPPRPEPQPKEPVLTDPINVVEHNQEVTADKTIFSDIQMDATEISTEDEVVSEVPKGRDEAVSDSEMGGNGAFAVIGTGGGGKGIFGKRSGGGDKRTIGRAFGPHSKGVITTLDSALRWLKRHQSPNGMWSATNYNVNCTGDIKCEPGKGAQGGDEAMTGYAVLCFLGAGYDHRTPSKYKPVVNKGIEWLLAAQKADGLIGSRNYEHPVAAMALAEAYGMTSDPALREPAQKAIDIIIARQSLDPKATDTAYAGLGWDYVNPNPSRNDTSVTCWNVFALKSAYGAGLNVKGGMDGSKKWLEGAWKAANKNWKDIRDPYKDTSIFPYIWNASNDVTEKDHLSFAGGCAAVFLGHKSGDIMLESLANDVEKRWLETGKWKNNMYCLYYSSLYAFQMSGERWIKWREAYVPYLIQRQWKDEDGECKSGTWDFEKQSFHGSDTSRVLLHTYATLSLEVAIRYDMVQKK